MVPAPKYQGKGAFLREQRQRIPIVPCNRHVVRPRERTRHRGCVSINVLGVVTDKSTEPPTYSGVLEVETLMFSRSKNGPPIHYFIADDDLKSSIGDAQTIIYSENYRLLEQVHFDDQRELESFLKASSETRPIVVHTDRSSRPVPGPVPASPTPLAFLRCVLAIR